MKEGLETFNQSLDVVYFKYLRYKASKKFMLMSFSAVLSLLNIFMLVGYPMVVQISDGFKNLFL